LFKSDMAVNVHLDLDAMCQLLLLCYVRCMRQGGSKCLFTVCASSQPTEESRQAYCSAVWLMTAIIASLRRRGFKMGQRKASACIVRHLLVPPPIWSLVCAWLQSLTWAAQTTGYWLAILGNATSNGAHFVILL